jgi:uncharacterized membrane protein YadS
MRYVVAGYVIVLTLLFLYGAQLVWRQRRLIRAAARVEMVASMGDSVGGPAAVAGTEPVEG